MVCLVLEGPIPYRRASEKQEWGGKGGCLKETEALVGLLPPGGILNWNAQNNQSHSRRTDVERVPAGWGGIIFLSYKEITAVCQTHRPFLCSVSSICKCYSVDLNGATICAGLGRSFDITTLLIYCQLLIGKAPAFVQLLSSVCRASRNPEAITLPCVSAYYHKCIILLTAVKERLPAAQTK